MGCYWRTCLFDSCRYGLPTSSSQCITGAVIGVGLCENINGKGVNWRQFLRQFASWVATLFLVGFGTAAVFAQVTLLPRCAHHGSMPFTSKLQRVLLAHK